MSNFRRYYREGQIYFITVVTYNRDRILVNNIGHFWDSIGHVRTIIPFSITSWMILPDRFHMMITPEKNTLSEIIQRFKLSFSMRYHKKIVAPRGRVWQYRFWDHIIRDERDFEAHFHYVHYNPTKHGYTERPHDWKYSSMGDFMDIYDPDWAVREDDYKDTNFGE
jgi:putative transposase